MVETHIPLDFSLGTAASIGSNSAADVPRYILYGDANARPDWFVNVEPLDARCRERGWLIAPHTHPRFMQIVICEHGGGDMSVDGGTLPFAASTVLVVPPNRIHGFRYEEATDGWVVTIDNNYLADLLVRAPALKTVLEHSGVFAIAPAALPDIASRIRELVSELLDIRQGNAIGAEIHLLSVLLLLLRHWPAADNHAHASGGRHDLVRRFKELVEQRYREQPNLTIVADRLGVSAAQLRLACRLVTGMSPIEVMHDRILVEAKRCLVYTTMTIGEIAHRLGFSDPAYFTRFFTRRTARSPTGYRRREHFSERHAPLR